MLKVHLTTAILNNTIRLIYYQLNKLSKHSNFLLMSSKSRCAIKEIIINILPSTDNQIVNTIVKYMF